MTTVGFIGLGSMGLPMASNLARRGFPVRGFDVRPDAVAALAEAGGTPAASVAEAADGADALVLMVVNAAQAEEIRTPADPSTIDTFQALGAATQQINFSELYVALQQGVVDGQENPLVNIHSSKLHEVNRFISLSGHKWECSPVVASRITWGRLNEADRKLINDVAREASEHNRQLMEESDEKLPGEYRANQALTINEVDQDAFRAATAPVLDKWEQKPFGDFVKRLRAAAAA